MIFRTGALGTIVEDGGDVWWALVAGYSDLQPWPKIDCALEGSLWDDSLADEAWDNVTGEDERRTV